MICKNEDCKIEFNWRKNSPGLYGYCRNCGEEQERKRGNTRPGGVMEYSHKTAPTIRLFNDISDAKKVLKAGERNTGHVITSIVRNKC